MRGDPFFDLSDYGPSGNGSEWLPEVLWLIVCIVLVIYFFRIINLKYDDYLFNVIFTSVAAILLFISIFVKDSSELFIVVRYFMTLSLLILISLSVYYKKSKVAWSFRILLFSLLIIYNHLIPIYLNSRDAWIVIDCFGIIILIFNSIHSYCIAEPFSIERGKRVNEVSNYSNSFLDFIFPGGLYFIFPRHDDDFAGYPLLTIFILFLLFIVFAIIVY